MKKKDFIFLCIIWCLGFVTWAFGFWLNSFDKHKLDSAYIRGLGLGIDLGICISLYVLINYLLTEEDNKCVGNKNERRRIKKVVGKSQR